jgi:hypothetical protein
MSLWISVYCRKRLGAMSASRLEKIIKRGMADWQDFFSRVTVTEPPPGNGVLHFYYRLWEYQVTADSPAELRASVRDAPPIVMHRVSRKDEVEGYVREQLEEYLQGRRGKGAKRVRDHLADVRDIFCFCLKQHHYADGCGELLASAAAEGLAVLGDGLIREDEGGWLQVNADFIDEVLKP